jgi:hypothetical protein
MACIVCESNKIITLSCTHEICLACVIKIYKGQNTPCPGCRQPINLPLDLTPCARCQIITADYCASCDAYLCSECWPQIHCFKPLVYHKKEKFNLDITGRQLIVDKITKLNEDLDKLEANEGALKGNDKSGSVKDKVLSELKDKFDQCHKQLVEQYLKMEQYINDETEKKLFDLYHKKAQLSGASELCKLRLFEHSVEELAIDNIGHITYKSNLEYNIKYNEVVLPQIVSVSESDEYVLEKDGRRVIYNEFGQTHHETLPAVIYPDGSKEWRKNGKMHRDGDLPAYVNKDGTMGWYRDGVLHREDDQPAFVKADGGRMWYVDGRLHRNVDRPSIVYPDGRCEWHKYGILQKETL